MATGHRSVEIEDEVAANFGAFNPPGNALYRG